MSPHTKCKPTPDETRYTCLYITLTNVHTETREVLFLLKRSPTFSYLIKEPLEEVVLCVFVVP